ncbi:MAG: transcription-repair coupling factor [Eubacterium sp.]|nr:transcription-repair coupling factor [Eubacterium sp.]MDD7210136.1 transcription-repair coupling factor [Lachnospiraceae bacterium]MDY5498371.1 transcription-repair coupling factor [Anaerobutyricum sp.]
MKTFEEPLLRSEFYEKIQKSLKEGRYPLALNGCVDSQKAHMIPNLGKEYSCRFVLTYKEEKARELYEDLSFFDPDTVWYPSRDVLFYSADVHSNHIERKRMEILKKLSEKKKLTIVAGLDVLMEKMIPMEEFKKKCLFLDFDSVVDTEALKIKLTELGYENTGMVETPGQFGIRGGIIDIFPLTEELPVRIELWGDEIDSIRSFDPETQRSIEKFEKVEIYPATEMILSRDKMEKAIRQMKEEYKKQESIFQKEKKKTEKARLKQMTERTEDELRSFGNAEGSEALLSYFYEETVSLLSYLPKDTLFFIDEPHRVLEKGKTYEQEFSMCMQNRLEGGYVLPGQADLLFPYEEILAKVMNRPLILLSCVIQDAGYFRPMEIHSLNVKPVPSYNNSFDQLVKDLNRWKKQKYRIVLLSSSSTRARRLAENVKDCGLLACYVSDFDKQIAPGEIIVAGGRLSGGFEYPDLSFVVLSEKDIFKERKTKKRKKKSSYSGQKINTLSDISVGDYVVHEKYGLGIYRGMEKIESDGVTKDYINIEYKDASNLFIPASQLELIQKYASLSAKKPKLNKLGGNEWEKTKTRVRSQVQIAAKDLVSLYAQRQAREGFAYSKDTIWQKEFEELFPYEETEDQLAAIEDTKRDMESHKIMDRLICGDVGYGKTEVAIRAAFKAVMDSKQVVYLVPTTILAQQHYNSFRERMEHYPVEIAMLSRFCTPKEQKRISDGLKNGTIDIVIGTHKVLSKTISYKNLGLLIIDEEQRFGVKQKEKIKQLKKDVDVLALSATPIPRTLHMSLAGIRDMSVLEIPPVDRRAIQTYVMEYNEELVREAIERELARGGQVYYVYNRVSNIDQVAARLKELLPEASVEYAHGRMGERQLEGIMSDFIEKKIDVLVSTTIIETGLDIPNVNTMIIQDAQMFGLSQLYQLRGRVGRSNRTAYAFLMYRRDTVLKEEAEKRLKAIREFTDLGSGFKIAMRDLEIRGAGNLLGAEQSGHMEAVGYDLYCKMLNEAVTAMKGEQKEEDTFDTSIDLSVDAFMPETYIKSEAEKLSWYKRIALIATREEYEDLVEELTDRYGDPPAPLLRLMDVALLKDEAHQAWILSIEQKGDTIYFTMNPRAKVRVEEIDGFLKKYRNQMKIRTEMNPVFLFDASRVPKKELLTKVREIIGQIKALQEPAPAQKK